MVHLLLWYLVSVRFCTKKDICRTCWCEDQITISLLLLLYNKTYLPCLALMTNALYMHIMGTALC